MWKTEARVFETPIRYVRLFSVHFQNNLKNAYLKKFVKTTIQRSKFNKSEKKWRKKFLIISK